MRVCLRRRPVRRGRLPGAPRTRITARGSDICLPLALLLAGSAAGAEDRNPPPWRGQPLTTFQHWTFNQPPATYPQTEDALDCGPQPPDKSFNPYATGTKDLYLLIRGLDPPKTEWLDTMLGMQGVWRLEKTTWQDLPFFGYLSFFIANANRPGHAKEIRVQVTSMEVAGPPQVLAYADLPPPAVIIVRMEPEGPPIQLANGATHRTFVGRAPGCPPKDTVNIWHPFNLQHPQESSVVYVDQVVVDTICRPADKKRPDKRRR